MRAFGRWLGRALALVLVAVLALWLLAPEEPVDREISFKDDSLPGDLDAYLAERESATDITPGAEKQIVWAGARGARTPVAIVYLHGFSATAQEIRPVPDEVARALGANLYFTRLKGHGRGPAALAEPRAGDWLEDTAEAMAIGRRLGERVIVIGTSTGAALAVFAATDPALSRDMAGVVMISPNFGVAGTAGRILDLPLVRWWGPLLAGATRSFPPQNAEHGRYWTTTYPTEALIPMAALVRAARALDFAQAKAPALILFSPKDKVIDLSRIPPVAAAWGGGARVEELSLTDRDDPYGHVITGDILSPAQTAPAVALIVDWARGI